MAKALINPALLRWGRETGGVSVEEAARRVKVPRGQLEAWESGASLPTVRQAMDLAHIYRRPLAAFCLASPPVQPREPLDYRRTPSQEPTMGPSLRQAHRHRAIALYLDDVLGTPAAPFPLVATQEAEPERMAEVVRRALGVPVLPQGAGASASQAFRAWRSATETANGTLVFVMRGVPVSDGRGFSCLTFLDPWWR